MSTASFAALVESIQAVHRELLAQAGKAINISLTLRNWLIGHYIAEYELNGKDRAEYGENMLGRLSMEFQGSGVSACGKRQLYWYLRFYHVYPQIVRSAIALSPVGILLCTDKNQALAEYALAGMDNQLFVSRYLLELPTKETMQRFIDEQLREVGE